MNNFSEFNPTPNIPTENNGGSNFFYYVNINLNSGGLLGFPGQMISGQRVSGQSLNLNQLQSGAIQGDHSVDGMKETALAVQKLSTSIFHGRPLSQKLHVDNKPEVKLSTIAKKHPQSSDIQSQELQDRIDNILKQTREELEELENEHKKELLAQIVVTYNIVLNSVTE